MMTTTSERPQRIGEQHLDNVWDRICAETQPYFDSIGKPNPSASQRIKKFDERRAVAMAPQEAVGSMDGLRAALVEAQKANSVAQLYSPSQHPQSADFGIIRNSTAKVIKYLQKALAASPAVQQTTKFSLPTTNEGWMRLLCDAKGRPDYTLINNIIAQHERDSATFEAMAPAGVQSDAENKTPEQHAKEWIDSHINPDGTTCFDADLMKFQSSLATWFMSAMREAALRGIKAGLDKSLNEMMSSLSLGQAANRIRALSPETILEGK